MRRLLIAVAIGVLALAPVAVAARVLSYQGYTSQGFQIKFKRNSHGIYRMSIVVRANCQNANGQNQGDYDFTSRATDTHADPIRSGAFTTALAGGGNAPDVVIRGKLNRHGTARGTLTASGHGKGPGGEDLGTCKSPRVRWTAAP
ncbi:MAG: hypothetical protein ACJ77Z_11185 [Thermoleophilaceae bacterium]